MYFVIKDSTNIFSEKLTDKIYGYFIRKYPVGFGYLDVRLRGENSLVNTDFGNIAQIIILYFA